MSTVTQLMCIAAMTALLFAHQHQAIQAQVKNVNCNVLPIQSLDLPHTSGDLVYSVGDTATSLLGRFNQQPRLVFDDLVSPNGLYIADYYALDTSSEGSTIAVYDSSGEQIYNGAPSLARVRNTHWLGNDRLLSLVATVTSRRNTFNGIRYTYEFGYFTINPFTREYTFTVPPRPSPFDPELPFYRAGDPFVLTGYSLTFDGRYLFNDMPLYDFIEEELLVRPNFERGYPSSTSHRLIRVDSRSMDSAEQIDVHVYDFDTDESIRLITFYPDTRISFEAWSPDEAQLVYSLNYPDEDITSFRNIELVSLQTGDVQSTCLGNYNVNTHSSAVFWSRDSQFLAVQAGLEGQDSNESFGLYLYDTQTGDIYQVYQGRADIIGWMASPDTE
ncbi:MAG: hypothetical protein SF162_20070 [bacterium]|nr:hypothetical protein [bacterium]